MAFEAESHLPLALMVMTRQPGRCYRNNMMSSTGREQEAIDAGRLGVFEHAVPLAALKQGDQGIHHAVDQPPGQHSAQSAKPGRSWSQAKAPALHPLRAG